ncbi:MAG: hypothetical protein E7607_01055 [Ruminococcaceae bacterium]|nr:hypothetical protein [Oscillospiraceae bacterium]
MVDFEESIDKISNLVYDDSNDTETSNGGEGMNAKDMLLAALRETKTTQAEAATKVGWMPQQLSQRIVRNSIRADDFLSLLEAIGIEVTLTVRDTGNPVRVYVKGAGRRVKAMVDRVTYDTAASNAISNNFYADGVNEYTDGKAMELYIDKEGRYFFAEYSNWEGGKDRISPVSAAEAAAFIEKYGTELDKKPKTDE